MTQALDNDRRFPVRMYPAAHADTIVERRLSQAGVFHLIKILQNSIFYRTTAIALKMLLSRAVYTGP